MSRTPLQPSPTPLQPSPTPLLVSPRAFLRLASPPPTNIIAGAQSRHKSHSDAICPLGHELHQPEPKARAAHVYQQIRPQPEGKTHRRNALKPTPKLLSSIAVVCLHLSHLSQPIPTLQSDKLCSGWTKATCSYDMELIMWGQAVTFPV